MPAWSRFAGSFRPGVLVVGLAIGTAAACNDARPPTAPSGTSESPFTPSSLPPTPVTAGPTHRLTGVVADESGKPLPGVRVALDYPSAGLGVASTPASHCPTFGRFCWLTATTDASGVYRAEFSPGAWDLTPGPGYVYAWTGDSQVDVQPLAAGTTDVVQNLTIRAKRRLAPGESVLVDVGSTSSLCTDLEDYMGEMSFNSRCAVIVTEIATPGTLIVGARTTAGEPAHVFFFATTGNYSGLQRQVAPGVHEVPIGGGRYQFYIGHPIPSEPRQYEVSLSLR